MRKINKKAVSPIITTVLLIAMVVILAVIILLWSRGFIKETILKEIKGDSKRVEEFCKDIKMVPILNEDDTFGFTNSGNVPIYAVNLKTVDKDSGDSHINKLELAEGGRVNPGISTFLKGYSYVNYDEVKVIPVLLGKSKSGAVKEFPCPEINGLVI